MFSEPAADLPAPDLLYILEVIADSRYSRLNRASVILPRDPRRREALKPPLLTSSRFFIAAILLIVPKADGSGLALSLWSAQIWTATQIAWEERMTLRMGSIRVAAVALAGALALLAPTAATANDYPTEARVDYVLGCMAANGQDYLTMQKCSCSIDAIAEAIPYEDYERVETIVRMRDRRGELGVLFRTSRMLEDDMQEFKRAQVQADLQCF